MKPLTDKQQKEYNEIISEMIGFENKQHELKLKCLEVVKSNFSETDYEDILHYIEHCDFTDRFEITTKAPDFEKEDEVYGLGLWVDQYRNGGYSGDSFAGCIFIKINQTEYLKFHYSM